MTPDIIGLWICGIVLGSGIISWIMGVRDSSIIVGPIIVGLLAGFIILMDSMGG